MTNRWSKGRGRAHRGQFRRPSTCEGRLEACTVHGEGDGGMKEREGNCRLQHPFQEREPHTTTQEVCAASKSSNTHNYACGKIISTIKSTHPIGHHHRREVGRMDVLVCAPAPGGAGGGGGREVSPRLAVAGCRGQARQLAAGCGQARRAASNRRPRAVSTRWGTGLALPRGRVSVRPTRAGPNAA
jgi:hypothetical protein